MWHRAPRGNVTHNPKPNQQTSRHKKGSNGKDEEGDSFQPRKGPITMPHDKSKIGSRSEKKRAKGVCRRGERDTCIIDTQGK